MEVANCHYSIKNQEVAPVKCHCDYVIHHIR